MTIFYEEKLQHFRVAIREILELVPTDLDQVLRQGLTSYIQEQLEPYAISGKQYRYLDALQNQLSRFVDEGGLLVLDVNSQEYESISREAYMQALYDLLFHDVRILNSLLLVQMQTMAHWNYYLTNATDRSLNKFLDRLTQYTTLKKQMQVFQAWFVGYKICLNTDLPIEKCLFDYDHDPFVATIEQIPTDNEAHQIVLERYHSFLSATEQNAIADQWLSKAKQGDRKSWRLYQLWQATHQNAYQKMYKKQSQFLTQWLDKITPYAKSFSEPKAWLVAGLLAGSAIGGLYFVGGVIALSFLVVGWESLDKQHQQIKHIKQFEFNQHQLSSTGYLPINKIDNDGQTILMRLVTQCETSHDITLIRQLIALGANVNQQDPKGNTALHLLYERKQTLTADYYLAIAQALICDGAADLSLMNREQHYLSDLFAKSTPWELNSETA